MMPAMSELWISVVMGAVITAYVVSVYFTLQRKQERKKDEKREFRKTLVAGLKSGAVSDIEDVINLYKGITGIQAEDAGYLHGLGQHLREFLVDLVSGNLDEELDNQAVVEWKNKITSFIKINEETSPYADLPPAERNALNDASAFLQKDDKESVRQKLFELGGMIQARYDDILKLQRINKYVVPLAIIGVVLTVTFGILAILR
jgi:hypothetical protein